MPVDTRGKLAPTLFYNVPSIGGCIVTFCIVQNPHETPQAKTRFCVGKAQHFTARSSFRRSKSKFWTLQTSSFSAKWCRIKAKGNVSSD